MVTLQWLPLSITCMKSEELRHNDSDYSHVGLMDAGAWVWAHGHPTSRHTPRRPSRRPGRRYVSHLQLRRNFSFVWAPFHLRGNRNAIPAVLSKVWLSLTIRWTPRASPLFFWIELRSSLCRSPWCRKILLVPARKSIGALSPRIGGTAGNMNAPQNSWHVFLVNCRSVGHHSHTSACLRTR